MRRKFAFGLGLAGVLSGAGAVIGQFASDRPPAPPPATAPGTPTAPVTPPTSPPAAPRANIPAPSAPAAPPALPAGVRPVGQTGGAYVAPVGGVAAPAAGPVTTAGFSGIAPQDTPRAPAAPAETEIRSALGPNHPWAVKPEHGAFFICVKSYSRPSRPQPGDTGPSARELAEALATDVRDLYRVQAFLYEYVSEERKAEMASIQSARARAKMFADQLDKYRQEAQLKGMTFLEDGRVTARYKTVNYQEQVAVLVGGFQSDEDARKALDRVRTWPSPKNKQLMDGAAVVQTGRDGKPVLGEWHMNPYATAHVVPNPTVERPAQPADAATGLDPFVVKLNEDRPYSLLKATKGWTLAVKSFSAPVEIVSRDSGGGGGLMQKITGRKGADVLKAGAEQAEKLAGALRVMTDKNGNPLGLEAFVLHTRSASLVTVGQFDGPNDPDLLQKKRLLASMNLLVTEDKSGTKPVTNAPSLFGNLMPIPIPKP